MACEFSLLLCRRQLLCELSRNHAEGKTVAVENVDVIAEELEHRLKAKVKARKVNNTQGMHSHSEVVPYLSLELVR